MEADHRTEHAGFHLRLDERSGDHVHVSLNLRLGIRLQDVRLDGLHFTDQLSQFDSTIVEPSEEAGERLAVDLFGDGEQFSRSVTDDLRCRLGFALSLGVSHRFELSRDVPAHTLLPQCWVGLLMR